MAPKKPRAKKPAKVAVATVSETQEIHKEEGEAPKRELKRQSTDQVVKQRLRDNFKDWADEEIDLELVNGVSLRGELNSDVRKERTAGKYNFKPGHFYYEGKKLKFKRKATADSQLTALINESDEIDADWLKAISLASRVPHPDRELFRQQIRSTMKAPTEITIIAILRFSLTLNPRNPKLLAVAMEVMRFLGAIGLMRTHPGMLQIIRPWADKSLTVAWLKSSSRKMSQEAFLEVHADASSILLQKDLLTMVVASYKTDPHIVSQEIATLCEASDLANSMFGGSYLITASKRVETYIDTELTNFIARNKVIDEQGCAEFLTSIMKKLDANPAAKVLPHKRTIKFLYRGEAYPAKVSSLVSEVQIKLAAAWKTIAVDHGLLDQFWIEPVLGLQMGICPKEPTVDPILLVQAKIARAACKTAADEYKGLDANVIKELVDDQANHFLMIDRDFIVELELLKAISGQSNGQRLYDMILGILPSETSEKSAEHALVNIERIKNLAVYKLAASEVKAKVDIVQKIVGKLVDGREPDTDIQSSDPFVLSFMNKLQYFVRVQGSASSDGTALTMFGKAAVEHLFQQAQTKVTDGTLTSADLATALTYRFLLNDNRKKELDQMALSTACAVLQKKRALTQILRGSSKKSKDENHTIDVGLSFFKK